jgi:AhpD family alkylhydroperoxidase
MSRLSYKEVSPDAYRAVLQLESHVRKSGLDRALVDLICLRASQLNGCAFCVDMHAKDLRAHGEKDERIDCLVVWRECPFYSERERAALAWTEAVTTLTNRDVPEELFQATRKALGDKDLVELTLAISTINVWNRMNIAFHTDAGKYQPTPR